MKNQLEQLQTALNKEYPQLLKLEKNKVICKPEPFSFEYGLLFEHEDRNCIISVYGYDQNLRCIFEWDHCLIFEIFSTDIKRLGKIILNWVFKKSMPSIMQIQFPEIKFSELAKYYENGEGIKGEFIESWNSIEKFYSTLFSDEWKTREDDALRLIQAMRDLLLDEKLRAGQSLWFFILSRSRRHGLQENTPYLQITFLGHNRMTIKSYFDNEEKDINSEVKYEGNLKGLVTNLLKEKIE